MAPGKNITMIYRLYSFFFTLALPFMFARLWLKGRKNKAYRQHWAERIGHLPFQLKQSIWLHAVSLGEIVAAAPIIEKLLSRDSKQRLVLSCTTPTGRAEAQKWAKKFPDRVFVIYLPYDAAFALQSAVSSIRPTLLIVMETEIWPNLFRLVKAPIIIANARISDHSFPSYQRFRFAFKPCFQYVNEVAAQSELDAQRFQTLGAPKISVMGNIKYDLAEPTDAIQKAAEIQARWSQRLIICAGSTHESEERLLLEAYGQLKIQFPTLLLILIPRHPERFDHVANLVNGMHFSCLRRTENKPLHNEDVLLVDAMGEVKTFYALADLVFVGGSIITLGGHNILEGAILAKPIFVGPHMQNARQVVREFLDHDALIQLKTTSLAELTDTLQELLSDTTRRNTLGQNAFNLIEKNKGALIHLLAIVDRLMQA